MAMLNAPILLLKEGAEVTRGKEQLVANIGACYAVAETIRSTLGPRGMDKLIHSEREITITNDGATIMRLLNVVHPVARMLVEVSKNQDDQVGDGTTSVVLFAAELLHEAKQFIEEGTSPQVIIDGLELALKLVCEKIDESCWKVPKESTEGLRDLLVRIGETALQSKLVSFNKTFFSNMIVDAVIALRSDSSCDDIAIKKVGGGSTTDSFLVRGIAFKKTFSYAGFEQQPKKFATPKVMLLNIELELKAEKDNAEIRLKSPKDYQGIVQAEWDIIYDKLDKIIATGAKIVLSQLPIGDLATQYFADHKVFCAGRVEENDMKRAAIITGTTILSTVHAVNEKCLGVCDSFEEIQLGSERWNILRCTTNTLMTIVLRGCATRFVDEAERSLRDAIMSVHRSAQNPRVVGGAGSCEMLVSHWLQGKAMEYEGKELLVLEAFARALEVIPRSLATNAAMDVSTTLGKLRNFHQTTPGCWSGVDCRTKDVIDSKTNFVWEPSVMKKTMLQGATLMAMLILSIDETIEAPRQRNPDDQPRQNSRRQPATLPRGGIRR